MRLLKPTREGITEAARAIREGKLVVVPTETVYGLAADALNAEAVSRIYQAKGRPPENPLIVHVSSIAQAKRLVSHWPEEAEKLANAFWPGPFTLVLPKLKHANPSTLLHSLPAIVTGGLETVAVRLPGNDICTRLIDAAARPLAAPSANRFMSLSPTKVDHLDEGLLHHVEFVIDGGPCIVGIESTVLGLVEEPTLLRPGVITKRQIEQVLRRTIADRQTPIDNGHHSPGMYPRHYSPKTPVYIVEQASARVALVFDHPTADQIKMPTNAADYAAWLYAALHTLDNLGASKIEIQAPPRVAEWDAVWDRLHKMQTT